MPPTTHRKIVILPADVVNRIAAGEVVQRPFSVVKELLENSLDAGATKVVVTFTAPHKQTASSCGSLKVSDNGCGMGPDDLPLATAKHATSKLHSVQDFAQLQTFGFRGEALASIAVVSRLSILTRTTTTPSGYLMNYVEGKPVPNQQPIPKARPVGTTVTVQDLFYDFPQRRPARDDFKGILDVVQSYALLCAADGVGLVCERVGANHNNSASTELNTAVAAVTAVRSSTDDNPKEKPNLSLRARKQVIALVYGSHFENHLRDFECQEVTTDSQTEESKESPLNKDHEMDPSTTEELIYACQGIVALPSVVQSGKKEKPVFTLFINRRLVDSKPIQRALEDVYAQFASQKPPFLFLSVQVPPHTIDVNVHPSKRECALMNLDLIVQSLSDKLRQVLQETGQSFSLSQPMRSGTTDGVLPIQPVMENPYKRQKRTSDASEPPPSADKDSSLSQALLSQEPTSSALSQKSVPSSKKIRTDRSTQQGALLPFVVRRESMLSQNSQASASNTQTMSQDSTSSSSSQSSQGVTDVSPSKFVHQPGCPLNHHTPSSSVDLTQPGAFAAVASQCTCNTKTLSNVATGAASAIRLPRQALHRPRKVPPKECHYVSIRALRKSVEAKKDDALYGKLRQAYFVGVVNTQRSLVQVGEELVLFNHGQAARDLFYQLALNHFPGGAIAAKIGPIDIQEMVARCVQLEDLLQESTATPPPPSLLDISETNHILAEEAATYLLQQAAMLEEYFSIVIRKNEEGRIVLEGLPVLLDGYTPAPHALPTFLLRLATEVSWSEEKPCFHNVCEELGRFYGSVASDEHLTSHVRHTLFPALTTLLVPNSELVETHGFATVTKLSKLYRIFERC